MPRTLLIHAPAHPARDDLADVTRLAGRLGGVTTVDAPPDRELAGLVEASCRADPEIEHVIVLAAPSTLRGWPLAARRAYRGLDHRPRTVFAFDTATPVTWLRVLAGRLTGTVHRAVHTDAAKPGGRVLVRSVRPADRTDPDAADRHAATIIGVPPYYTSLLQRFRSLGGRLRDRGRREAARRLSRPQGGTKLERLGSPLCGWWVPVGSARPGAVAYCAGAGEDITFDLELHARGCVVRTLDPTPRAIEHVGRVAPDGPRFRFVPVGLWDTTTELRFYAPAGVGVSHSAVNLGATSEYFTAPVTTLGAVASELGDATIDLLKLDVEGAEYRVIDSLLASPLRPGVLCVEFDQPVPVRRVVGAVRKLAAAGYRLACVEGWNYTFLRGEFCGAAAPVTTADPAA